MRNYSNLPVPHALKQSHTGCLYMSNLNGERFLLPRIKKAFSFSFKHSGGHDFFVDEKGKTTVAACLNGCSVCKGREHNHE